MPKTFDRLVSLSWAYEIKPQQCTVCLQRKVSGRMVQVLKNVQEKSILMDSCGLWLCLCPSEPAWSPEDKKKKKTSPIMRFYSLKYQAAGSPLCRGKLCIPSNSRIVVGVGKLVYVCYLRCPQGTGVNPVSLCCRNSRNKINEQTKSKTNM